MSSDTVGMGPAFGFFGPKAITVDTAGVILDAGTILVVDITLAAVFKVDPGNGNRPIVSSGTVGAGPPFDPFLFSPQAITVDAAGFLVVTVQNNTGTVSAVVRINPVSGDRTVLSGCIDNACSGIVGDPNDPLLINPRGIASEAGTFIVADAGLDAVVRIDPATGKRTIVSGPVDGDVCSESSDIRGSGPCFDFPEGIAVEADGSLVVVNALLASGSVVRTDPVTGKRRILSLLRQ